MPRRSGRGAIGADARPNWQERAPASLFGPSFHTKITVNRSPAGMSGRIVFLRAFTRPSYLGE